jgi:hypothetical protein
MGCTKNHSRTWNSWILIVISIVGPLCSSAAEAAFAVKSAFTFGELYTDNIFFTKDKDHDFVTTLTPTLSILYAPAGEIAPTLNLNISPSGLIFARHSELNNFGDNLNLNGGYTYQYSPRLSFNVSDVLGRQGGYSLGPLAQGVFQLPSTPTSPPPVGGTIPGQGNQNLSNFTSGQANSQIWNNFAVLGTYLYRPDMNFTGGYTNNVVHYIDQGGTDLYQTIGVRGVYNWRRDHNLHAGYWISIYTTRNNGTSVVNNFDFGDDYFSNIQIQLSPTLTLAASTGISFNTSNSGPTVANNSNVTITKIWQTATLSAGLQQGLTPSFGISTLSNTTSLYSYFNMRLTEKLNAIAGVNFALYRTDDGNFRTFQTSSGMQYQFNPWLSSNLFYSYRFADTSSRAAAASSNVLQAGIVRANSVYVTLTATFDLWPNVGLARSISSSALSPIVRTPFPVTIPAPSSTPAPIP